MASVKLYLDTRRAIKDGTYPLKLSFNHKNSFLVNLDVYISQEQWDNDRIIKHPQERTLNGYVEKRYSTAKNILYDLRTLGRLHALSDKELRSLIETNTTISKEEDAPVLFEERYKAYISTMERAGTLDTYRNMFKKVTAFTNTKTLNLEQMNYAWLKDFDQYMKEDGLAPNTRGIYFRNIRVIFNDAIDRDIVSLNLYPFRKFRIPKEATRKRALTVEELQTFKNHKCETSQEQYRDVFMLIFYLIGINMIDLCHLKEIHNGYIEYVRAKTGRLYTIKVEPEALEIIERYRGTDYLLNILDRHKNYKNYLSRTNRNLQEIGEVEVVNRKHGRLGKLKKTGLFPELSTYWARHTWATIAASLDVPKETIAAGLGHGGSTVTDIYISFDQKKIDEANRKVIDYLFNKTT